MQPTIRNSERVLVLKISWSYRICRNDIIVFTKGEKKVVKRVIGLPGDSVRIVGNLCYINGERVCNHRNENICILTSNQSENISHGTNQITNPFHSSEKQPRLEVKVIEVFIKDSTNAHFFVLGDNILNSLDSRDYGLIAKSQVIGLIFSPYV